MEVVHVQLAHKGGEVAVLEIVGQDLGLEDGDVLDLKAVPLVVPADDLVIVVVLQVGAALTSSIE